MSSYNPSDPSLTSLPSSSARTRRSGKSVGEKIRELGFNFRSDRTSTISSNSLRHIVIKTEVNQPSNVSILTPSLNLEQITYYQPRVTHTDSQTGAKVYRIEKFETKSLGPKGITKISDIEVKSYKPSKKMIFRRKKRHSSVISRITGILDRGKSSSIIRDPSEETISLNYEPEEMVPKNINDLPESILQKIFFYISQQERVCTLSRVCRLWYFILKDPIFWLRLDFTGNKIPTSEIIKVIKNYTSLEILHLTSVPNTVEILQELCRCNNIIKELAIKHCDVSSQDFARIILHVVSCCTNIEVLDIKGMEFQCDRFYLELGRLRNLRRLTLSGNKLIKNTNLITVSINCRALRELRIVDIYSDNSSTCLRDDDMTFIISHLQKNLRTLKMDMQQLGNISFQAIVTCSNLEILGLENCLHLTGDVFRGFIALKKLKKFKLTRAINLKPEDFQFVFSNNAMQNIEKLNINGCWGVGDDGLEAIVKQLKSLKSLSLKNCKSITGKSILLLSDCPNLVRLNVAHTKIDTNHLFLLPQHAKDLQELVIDSSSFRKIEKLKQSNPSMTIRLSLSEYRSEEKLVTSF